MTTSKLPVRTSFTAFALLLATTATACGDQFGSADDADASAPGQNPGQASNDSDAGPKAPVVTGTPSNDTITEANGIFVSPKGNDANAGTRAAPFVTLQAAITAAAKVGKIVYACTGSYAEALVVADSISIIGGLDCTDPTAWKTGAAHSRIQSPTSPAATASSITAMTRLEALDIVAPDATDAGGSSIGFFADHSQNLTIVGSTITAGNGANGTDGADGIALQLGAGANGGASIPAVICSGVSAPVGSPAWCGFNGNLYTLQPGGAGGVAQCSGAPGHDGDSATSAGGAGGSGGLYQSEQGPVVAAAWVWANYSDSIAYVSQGGQTVGGTPGAPGDDGAAATEIGSLTSNGYQPANGNAGKDGGRGFGGSGGHGGNATDLPLETSRYVGAGARGPGGGAGGCPGLAGTAGTGGGASLGVALVESPIVLDSVTITSARGGGAGLGSLGSDPTDGGSQGARFGTATAAQPGGRGGNPGVSTNGGNGPSVGILSTGTAPTLKGTSKATPGAGGPAIPARTSADGTRTIPATPAGIAVDMKTL